MMLDAKEIHEVFMDCFYEDEEIDQAELEGGEMTPLLKLEGCMVNVGFDPARVQKNQEKIEAFLNEVPNIFYTGANFTMLYMDKDGNHWGEHKNCDELLILGLAIDRFHYLLPREVWKALPGGMPYIKLDEFKEEERWTIEQKLF